jgi:hypothetical protein
VIRVALAVLGTILVVGGCANVPKAFLEVDPSASVSAERVVALAGSVGAMSLVAPNAASGGSLVPFGATGLPPDAAWLSGDGSTLLATTLGGEVLLNPGLGSEAWVAASGDLAGTHQSWGFGSLELASTAGDSLPGVRRVALLEGDPGSGGPGRLIVETLAGTEVRGFGLPSAADSPPSWLPDGRIAVVVRDRRDQPEVVLIDPATGGTEVLAGQAVRSLAVAGGMVATVGTNGAVRAGPVAAWLTGEALLPVGIGSPAEAALQAQPAPSGTELAIVVSNADGDAASIHTLAAPGGCHEIARFVLPNGANRAVVSWLAVP